MTDKTPNKDDARKWLDSVEGGRSFAESLARVENVSQEIIKKRQVSHDDLLKPITL